ncbi:MAG: DUF87 domain-containing protein [Nanoarchaeota archaeon]
MAFDVIIGRSKKDVEKFGKEGTILMAKQYVKMGQTTSLSNPVYMDIAGAHVVFIVGKRGCLIGDTKVFTNRGYIDIKDFDSKHDLIYSYNGKEFELEKARLLKYDISDETMLEIRNNEGNKLTVTNEHPLLISKGKSFLWKKASDLKKGDLLGSIKKISLKNIKEDKNRVFGSKIIKIEKVDGIKEVYDLTVPKNHSFIANGVISHNSGKSYTLGAIAEGLTDLPLEIKQNLSIILVDTMGIYWTMKYPNFLDAELVKQWGLIPKGLDVKIYTPAGFFAQFKEEGIPTDYPFSIRPIDVGPEDWCRVFQIGANSAEGVLLSKVVQELNAKEESYTLETLISTVKADEESERVTKSIIVNQLEKAREWGIFSTEGTPLKDIVAGGQVTVLDISPYATMASGWDIKALVTGLICRTLFNQRMLSRKNEEFESVDQAQHYFSKEVEEKMTEPLVWIAVDEAHELLPREGKTAASDALITILREGRQPGISLILATQQPAKIHTDVMTQADIVIAHRLTAQMDVDALGSLMQSYMRKGLDAELNILPSTKGAALIFDDANERMFPVQMRPRFTWHGGGSPLAIKEKKNFHNDALRRIKDL